MASSLFRVPSILRTIILPSAGDFSRMTLISLRSSSASLEVNIFFCSAASLTLARSDRPYFFDSSGTGEPAGPKLPTQPFLLSQDRPHFAHVAYMSSNSTRSHSVTESSFFAAASTAAFLSDGTLSIATHPVLISFTNGASVFWSAGSLIFSSESSSTSTALSLERLNISSILTWPRFSAAFFSSPFLSTSTYGSHWPAFEIGRAHV